MTTNLKPLITTHMNVRSSDDRNLIISLCARALHMSTGEVRLLRYYSKQQTGFRPSAKHITNETGLSRMSVFKLRDKLVKHGIVAIQNENIYIDWYRLRLFSTLDPKLTGRRPYIKPVQLKREKSKYNYITNDLYYFLVYGRQEEVIDYFSRMSEEEYKSCCLQLRKRLAKERAHDKMYELDSNNNHEDIEQ